jgi:hypothetical protein
MYRNLAKCQTDYSEFLCGRPHMGHANAIVLLNEFPFHSQRVSGNDMNPITGTSVSTVLTDNLQAPPPSEYNIYSE